MSLDYLKTGRIESRFLAAGDVGEIKSSWEALVAQVPTCQPFCTYSWFDAWRNTFSESADAGVMALYDASRLVGVMPMVRASVRRGPALSVRFDYLPRDRRFLIDQPRFRCIPLHQVSPLINLESGNLRGGWLASPGCEEECVEALFRGLRALSQWHVGVFPIKTEETDVWAIAAARSGVRGYARDGRRSFFGIRRLVSWPEYEKSRSSNFRRHMRHAEERAAETGLMCRTFHGPENVSEGLDDLFAIGQRSWKSAGRSERVDFQPLFTERLQAFYRHLCSASSPEIVPHVHILSDGEGPAAGILGLMCGKQSFAALTFYDPRVAAASPGRLLFKEFLSFAWDNGAHSIDFNGSSPFVQYFSDHAVAYDQVLVFHDKPYARFLYAVSGRSGASKPFQSHLLSN